MTSSSSKVAFTKDKSGAKEKEKGGAGKAPTTNNSPVAQAAAEEDKENAPGGCDSSSSSSAPIEKGEETKAAGIGEGVKTPAAKTNGAVATR